MPPITLASKAIGYSVARSVCQGGKPSGYGDYGPWSDHPRLIAAEIRQAVAPDLSRAKIELRFGQVAGARALGANAMPWNWNPAVIDDLVMIASNHPDAADRHTPFHGFLVDADWQFGADNISLTYTAVSPAWRLHRDVLVYGRYMLSKAGDVTLYTGLPCEFNAGGKPNRKRGQEDPQIGQWQGASPSFGVPVFTHDGDPAARWWNFGRIMRYLMWRYNYYHAIPRGMFEFSTASGPQYPWVFNHIWTQAERKALVLEEPVVVSVEGMDLWTAMATVCQAAGYDMYEQITNGGGGSPVSTIKIVKKGAGRQRTVKHQAVARDGTMPALDIDKTNLFSASVAETSASCITRPVIAGGRYIVEITVELKSAWQSGGPAAAVVLEESRTKKRTTDWEKNYCKGGSDFDKYSGIFRLWDANTDGRYSGSPWNHDVPDMATLAGVAAGADTWPLMPYKPRLMLTRKSPNAESPSMGCRLEMGFFSGAAWTYVPLEPAGYDVMKDRLGIQLTVDNPSMITKGGLAKTGPLADSFPTYWNADPATIRMYLTISIATPDRVTMTPVWQPGAGTKFETTGWFDRKALGQQRWRSATSRAAAGVPGNSVDTVTSDTTHPDLRNVASAIQAANQDKMIEASLAVEWPDEDLELTDVVTRIEGIEKALAVNRGPATRFPRIVGRTLNLTADTHSMAIDLDSDRKAGVT